MMAWAETYWWSWLMCDMSFNHELYTENLKYKDPTALGRDHFNPNGLMYEGETLWDFINATRSAGIMPSDESWIFRKLIGVSGYLGVVQQLKQSLPFGGGAAAK